MIDSFFTYDNDPTANNPPSPNYFVSHIEEMLKYNIESENCSLMPNQGFPQMHHHMPEPLKFEEFAATSAYSTNPSTKNSPEYMQELEDQGSDEDDRIGAHSKVPPIIKKGIRKYYEPIVDNNTVYRYEDNPSEYRKARKRIQNRESATRVRNRKKNHVEELQDEIAIIKKEKDDLKLQNAALISENNNLKQQINFLEKVVSRNHDTEMSQMIECESLPDHHSLTQNSDSILRLMDKSSDDDMDASQVGCKYFRVAPSHKFKKHVTLLGVFTLLLGVYGLLPKSETGTVQLFSSPSSLFSSPKSMAVAIKPDSNIRGTVTDTPQFLGSTKGDREASVIWIVEIIVALCYLGYFCYVALNGYKTHVSKKRTQEASSLP